MWSDDDSSSSDSDGGGGATSWPESGRKAAPRLPAGEDAAVAAHVHNYMRANDIYQQIQQVLKDGGGGGAMGDDAEAIAHMQQKGIVDEVVAALRHTRVGANVGSGPPPAAARGKGPHIVLRLRGGTAFSDALRFDEDGEGGPAAFVQLHVNFAGQRFVSAAVPFTDRPELTGLFRLALRPGSARSFDHLELLNDKHQGPLQFAVTRVAGDGRVTVVGTNVLEWRRVLVTGNFEGPVELFRFGGGSQVPVGVISVRLELSPAIKDGSGLKNQFLSDHLRTEYMVRSKAESDFEAYCRTWWRDFTQLRPSHAERRVQLFARSELGIHRCVCTFVAPIREFRGPTAPPDDGHGSTPTSASSAAASVSSLLPTPRHAARFVSLIPFEQNGTLAGSPGVTDEGVWSSAHSFLARGAGDASDHANLLCSLLLGFGLDAYVAIGADEAGTATSWVCTLDRDSPGCGATFWSPLNGRRAPAVDGASSRGAAGYGKLFALYSHCAFYGNIQPDDSVGASLSFDVANESAWKPVEPRRISALTADPVLSIVPRAVRSAPHSVADVEAILEKQLRDEIAEHRKTAASSNEHGGSGGGLSIKWHEDLEAAIAPALYSYETERVHGIAPGNDDFQMAVRHTVPSGCTFRGFPVAFNHTDAKKIFSTLLEHKVAREILVTRGEIVAHGLRVRVALYPEGVMAVWLILACYFKPTAAAD
jgi:centrosomal protein CEP76